jgi:alpha-tubulin suppressor-like RCC1 family protein
VQQVAGGYYHTCAALTDGKVRCWGNNDSGESGQTVTAGQDIHPPAEVGGLTNVTGIAASFSTTCALLGGGTVECWGYNGGQQLGRGGTTNDTTPHPEHQPVVGLTGATFLRGSTGGHFCAIVAGGQVKCWGGNGSGQLGDGSSGGFKGTPVTVCAPGTTALPCSPMTGATFVVGGDSHTCAIVAGGKVACWGDDGQGELGRPSSANNKFPDFVSTAGFTAKYLTAGNQTTCAVDGAGVAQCWGSNGLGVIGNATTGAAVTAPTPVCTKQDCSTHLDVSTGVTTYDESACGISNGAVKCWGTNTAGQLGDGAATASQSYAASTAIASGAVYVASGGQANFAIVVNGASRDLLCWGADARHQCGLATAQARKTPVSPAW